MNPRYPSYLTVLPVSHIVCLYSDIKYPVRSHKKCTNKREESVTQNTNNLNAKLLESHTVKSFCT